MSTLPNSFLTPEEYLAIERKAEYKSEYFRGRMYAMSGASWVHNLLATRLTRLIDTHLDGKPCRVVGSDMRIHVAPDGLYTYPDLAVVCGQPQFVDAVVDTILNPVLLIEVLSPSTENYDRGLKAKMYRDIPSLQELLLVSQDRHEVELYRRRPDGSWSILERKGSDAVIELESIGYQLGLARLYSGILPEAAAHS